MQYLDQLEGRSKRHVLLIVTPKGEYPTQFSMSEYYNLEKSILKTPKSYISLYEEDEPEIMQFTAFRLFLKSLICDEKILHNKSLTKVKRVEKEVITSFIVAKHYYDTVPYSVKLEEKAISDGLTQAKKFLEKYPIEKFEFASVELEKNSDEANVFIKLDLQNANDDYYFDYVYVY